MVSTKWCRGKEESEPCVGAVRPHEPGLGTSIGTSGSVSPKLPGWDVLRYPIFLPLVTRGSRIPGFREYKEKAREHGLIGH